MGKNYSEAGDATSEEKKLGPFDLTFEAKAQYGLNLPTEELASLGVAADLFAGMFWPVAVDCEQFNMGVAMDTKIAMQVKIDLAGDINWGVVGMDIEWTGEGFEAQLGFDTDEWGAWSYEKANAIAGFASVAVTALGNHSTIQTTGTTNTTLQLQTGATGSQQNVSSNEKTPLSVLF
jgi:hypothetical protein